ncbi:MAG TPA: hypothetical protein VHY91_26865, partial [Pirellulales bacterium]|nr:hypothetical protein [Pirellulales bacterium]
MKAVLGIPAIAILIALALAGCRSKSVFFDEANEPHYHAMLTRDTDTSHVESDADQVALEPPPLTLSGEPPQYRDITLQEAIEM